MNTRTRKFVQIVADSVEIKAPIYEFGSLQVPGQEGLADLRPLFPNKKYIGCDMRPGVGVDKILNLHDIDLPSESVGTVICLNTLEHVEYPRTALKEIYRILRDDGMAVIMAPMNVAIHLEPSDYWRFTQDGMRSLLGDFQHSFVGYGGRPDFPETVVGLGFKGPQPDLATFRRSYEHWCKQKFPKDILRMITPPVVVEIIKKIISKYPDV